MSVSRPGGIVAGVALSVLLALASPSAAADTPADLGPVLAKPILDPNLPLSEVQAFCEARVPGMPKPASVAEWEQHAARMRADVLEKIVFRGDAKAWRDAPAKVEWLDTIQGGPGYKIRKLR